MTIQEIQKPIVQNFQKQWQAAQSMGPKSLLSNLSPESSTTGLNADFFERSSQSQLVDQKILNEYQNRMKESEDNQSRTDEKKSSYHYEDPLKKLYTKDSKVEYMDVLNLIHPESIQLSA